MSEICCEVLRLGAVKPHPNADRLEIAEVLGTQCVVPKDVYKAGQTVVWIPPGILLGKEAIANLNVENYLKAAKYPGDLVATNCRVSATRLRGEVSYGIVTQAKLSMNVGDSVDTVFDAVKYEPPTRGPGSNGDAASDYPDFHRYTDIENFYKYPDAFIEGTPVRITEKLHGTNCRLGLINRHGEFEFMAGSHKVNWKQETAAGKVPLWWQFMTQEVMSLLSDLCNEQNSVIVFGEIFGPGIQDLDYGVVEPQIRVFDITVNGTYLDYDKLMHSCRAHNVQTVPLLYEGPYSKEVIAAHTHGPTVMQYALGGIELKSKFKGREGVVVTPLSELFSDVIGGRMILKNVSADYLARDNAQDDE